MSDDPQPARPGLGRYLAEFEAPGFAFDTWRGSLTPTAQAFVHDAYDLGWVRGDVDLGAWSETAEATTAARRPVRPRPGRSRPGLEAPDDPHPAGPVLRRHAGIRLQLGFAHRDRSPDRGAGGRGERLTPAGTDAQQLPWDGRCRARGPEGRGGPAVAFAGGIRRDGLAPVPFSIVFPVGITQLRPVPGRSPKRPDPSPSHPTACSPGPRAGVADPTPRPRRRRSG